MFRNYSGHFYDGSVYIGKIADTFDSYPYTIKLIVSNVKYHSFWDSGTITFNSATNCNFYITNTIKNDGTLYGQTSASDINKISDIVSQTKEEVLKTLPWW